MTDQLAPAPPLLLRILQFPLVRLLLLGAFCALWIGLNNGFRVLFTDAPWKALAAVAAMSAAGLAVYAGVVRFIERRAVSELALPGMGGQLALGMALGAGLYGLCIALLVLLGCYRVDGLNPWQTLLPPLAMALGSGVMEELMYRGALFRIVEESLGSWISMLVSSLVFGASHLSNPQATLLGAQFISVEAGLLLAAAYLVTRRLWICMGLHAAWNFAQVGVFSGNVSGVVTAPGLLKVTVQGPELLTGGAFGVEASVVAFGVCTTAGVLMLLQAMRRGHLRPPFWARPGR